MKTALIGAILMALLSLTSGCATSQERDDSLTRASNEMAPDNPNRGDQTIRVTTRTPPELEARLVTFYSQFHPQQDRSRRLVYRADKPVDGCWWSRKSMLQEERFYYTRVFYYPVSHGIQIQNIPLDEVISGTCPLGITGVGYEVTFRAQNGDPVARYLQRLDIAVEEGGVKSAEATVRCKLNVAQGKKALRCDRDSKRSDAFYVGPLAPSGATLALDFLFEN